MAPKSGFARCTRFLVSLLVALVTIRTVPTDAFLPEDKITIPALKLKLGIDASGSFTHHWITVHALTGEYAGVGAPSGGLLRDVFDIPPDRVNAWTTQALDEIGNANAMVDFDNFLHRGPTGPEFHFDSESFTTSQAHIKRLTQDGADFLRNGRVHEAREALGRALHTLQDFYSHTNWIERGHINPTPALIPPNYQPFDASLLIPATGTWYTCDWIQPDPDDNSHLISGYFKDWGPARPWGCIHGGPYDYAGPIVGVGLNKDTFNPTLSPHWDRHLEAARVAGVATSAYFFGFYDLLKNAVPSAEAKQLMGNLLGIYDISITNNNMTSAAQISIAFGRYGFPEITDFLFPQITHGWPVPELIPCAKCAVGSPPGTGKIYEMVVSGDWSLSVTGLIGYTLRLPPNLEFTQVASDRGTTTPLSGHEHTDLFVLYPVSGPGHATNTYRVREVRVP